MPILETRHLSKNFGGLTVARDIDFKLEVGARHALIGPNGAGKTTFVSMLTGVLAPSTGGIYFEGRDITHLSQAKRVKRGIARTYQITNVFTGLSVLENVVLAIAEREGASWNMMRSARKYRDVVDGAMAILESFDIANEADRSTSQLAYGKQRLLEIALAMATRPRLLLLDEPAAGVPESASDTILQALNGLPPEVSVLVIEHDMDLVFRFADRITVLVGGEILVEGTPDEIASDQRVQEVYLGEQIDA